MFDKRDGFWLWFTRAQSLEADTSIVLHCFQIAKIDPFREVVIVCSDTDVLLMLLYHYQTLCTQTIMRVGRGDHKRDTNIGKPFEAAGDAESQVR